MVVMARKGQNHDVRSFKMDAWILRESDGVRTIYKETPLSITAMKRLVSGLVAAAVMSGLTSGSVLAHEKDYDNSKAPHESPHR